MPVSEETYQRVALEDDDHRWELVCGRLVRKPGMTALHNHLGRRLVRLLGAHLDMDRFDVGESGQVRVSSGTFRAPDVLVIPVEFVRRHEHERPTALEIYHDPLPLIVEIWSPSTGDYDVEEKLVEYQQRGDREIWRLHPHERTLTAWRRQPDGSYTETVYREGVVPLASLPGVQVDLSDLFT